MGGDYGFDPAGFCTTNAELKNQMEAEVRHCRLAMLCAAGWPMAELWGQDWFDGYFLADGGRAPSILNGGLLTDVQFPPLPTLFCSASSRCTASRSSRRSARSSARRCTATCTRRIWRVWARSGPGAWRATRTLIL